MSVLVYIELDGGAVKSSSLEAIVYGAKVGAVTALVAGNVEDSALEALGQYGAAAVVKVADEAVAQNIQGAASLIASVAAQEGSEVVVMARSSMVDAVSARLAIKMGASVATNVVSLPDTSNGFMVKRGIFTGKAFADVVLPEGKKILTIKKNVLPIAAGSGAATVKTIDYTVEANDQKVTQVDVKKAEGDVLLPEADLVVSAGRGLKGPENWGMIEDLAKTLGAATACSKPVSDMDWRPHHEHVGQTGIKIAPNLYIAVGISGAIQHLAGVNSSKTIVVVNKDPDAPFFKAADYGIVGDAFEVIPKLHEAIKKVL